MKIINKERKTVENMLNNKLPDEVKIFDVTYKIIYVDNPSEVDVDKREALWGQIDYWTRTIRVYHNGRSINDIWHTLWHEMIHAVCEKMKIETIEKDEKDIDLLATGINSIIVNNNFGYNYSNQHK